MKNTRRAAIATFLFAASMLLITICRTVEGSIRAPEDRLTEGVTIIYRGGDVVERSLKDNTYKRCMLPDDELIDLGKERIINEEQFIRIRHLREYGTCTRGNPIFVGKSSLHLNGYKIRR